MRLAVTFLISLTMAACGGNNPPETPPTGNKPPVAAFTLIPAEGTAPLEVEVNAGGSTDPDGRITSYAWEFGDGAQATGATASHTYTAPGKHTITLTVTDDEGATGQRQATVTVTAPPASQAPTAAFSVTPEAGAAPLAVELDASASSAPAGSIVSFAWEFGDGESGDGVAVSHTYREPAEYTVTLTVTDDEGATASSSRSVTVTEPTPRNQPPVATFTLTPDSGFVPLKVAFDASASSDPDGSIVSYDWSFGDGATGSGAQVTHTYTEAGPHTATLTVTDDGGATASHSYVVVAQPKLNLAPVAHISATALSGLPGLSVTFNASGSYDPDGSIESYEWHIGGRWDYSGPVITHTFEETGNHSVLLRVYDDKGYSGSASVDVLIYSGDYNLPPSAQFTATPQRGKAPLLVEFDASASFDHDGRIVSYEWDFGDGATDEGVSATHTYLGAGDYTVTLTVTDDAGDSHRRSTEIVVTAPNQPPVASFTATPPYGEAPLTVAFDASGSYDPDGSIVSYAWDFGDGAAGSGAYVTHTFEDANPYWVTLTITDNDGASASESTLVTATDWVMDPLFGVGIVAEGNIELGVRQRIEMNMWAGGGVRIHHGELADGYWARAGGSCVLREGTCEAHSPLPYAHLGPNFFEIRARVAAHLLGDPELSDIGAVCGLELSGGGSVICLGVGETLVLDGTHPEIIVIGHESSMIEVRGTIGSDSGHSIIIGGEISRSLQGSLIGDVTVLTLQDIRNSASLLASSTGARPVLISSGNIEIGVNAETTNAVLWAGRDVRLHGKLGAFVGSIVASGSLISNTGGLDTLILPDSIDNPYLPQVSTY